MTTFTIIAMICTLGQSPSDCIPQTSRSHYILGQESNELACMRQGMMSQARVQLEIAKDEYVKFMCVRN